MKEEEIIKVWKDFTDINDFKLNPDNTHVNLVVQGVLKNEEKHGLKLCPCRLRNKTFERDLELICPCNFKAQDNWEQKGMCWCGLFIKR
jgi:ferredoxin-thioredoxin reductase catalytic subunit